MVSLPLQLPRHPSAGGLYTNSRPRWAWYSVRSLGCSARSIHLYILCVNIFNDLNAVTIENKWCMTYLLYIYIHIHIHIYIYTHICIHIYPMNIAKSMPPFFFRAGAEELPDLLFEVHLLRQVQHVRNLRPNRELLGRLGRWVGNAKRKVRVNLCNYECYVCYVCYRHYVCYIYIMYLSIYQSIYQSI